METKELERLAIEFLIDGCFLRTSDVKKARRCYSIAWGFGRHLEDINLMEICTEFLERSGMDREAVRGYREIGYEIASFGIDYMEKRAKKALQRAIKIPISGGEK
jgi:hypothetical protein